MRILFVNSFYPPNIGGGAEIILASLVKGLGERRHQVAVLNTYDGTEMKSVETDDGVNLFYSPVRNLYWHFSNKSRPVWKRLLWHALDSYNVRAGSDVGKVIARFRPDLVSYHNLAGYSASAWYAAIQAKVPTVQVLHDYYALCPKSTLNNNGNNCQTQCRFCALMRMPHAALSNRLNAVVGVSQFVLNRHLQAGLFNQVSTQEVIFNARALVMTPAQPKNPDFLTFGFIGGLTPVKGIARLLDAFVSVAGQTDKKLRLLIAGTGKDDFVQALKQQYGSDSRIVFLGRVDPAEFFSGIDISVVPSVWNEPLGMVVAESLGFGVPVIGSKRGGIPEMVQHGINGLIFEPDELGALERAMSKLIANPDLLASMQRQAPASASVFLDEKMMFDKHENLYNRLIG